MQQNKFITFYENKDTLQIGYFIKGKKNGVFRTFFPKNKIESIINWNNDFQSGQSIYYHENGKVKQVGLFQKNKTIGNWFLYDEVGKLIIKKNFNHMKTNK